MYQLFMFLSRLILVQDTDNIMRKIYQVHVTGLSTMSRYIFDEECTKECIFLTLLTVLLEQSEI